MNIRSFNEGDVDFILELRLTYYQAIGEPLSDKQISDFMDEIEKSKTNPDEKIYVAEHEGFAGYIHLENKKYEIYIKAIHVKKEKQGIGIGTLLLEMANRYGAEKYVNKITLSVKPENEDAIKLYTKNKFKLDRYIMKKNIV